MYYIIHANLNSTVPVQTHCDTQIGWERERGILEHKKNSSICFQFDFVCMYKFFFIVNDNIIAFLRYLRILGLSNEHWIAHFSSVCHFPLAAHPQPHSNTNKLPLQCSTAVSTCYWYEGTWWRRLSRHLPWQREYRLCDQ